MSIMPQDALPAYTDPTNTFLAVAPVLNLRTAPASPAEPQALPDDFSPEELAEVRHFDIIELLDRAVLAGAVGSLDLGTVTLECFGSIVCALDTEDISTTDDITTIAKATRTGRLAVTVRVEVDGQVAA
ncbi:hypothetical protein [Kitasatospora sp. NBC_01300]|uniref:hypothetical protein n=1 Tax=Kitasatospora sp. NBC_01300 TaxID=2903574 RepID=UPI002F917258|nr:hypothetical protein OG556_40350 [Kitasatospora sp. NBC_01300]